MKLDVHGFEIVVNFFYAQIVAQLLVWWLVWLAVVRTMRGHSPISIAVPIAVVAVLATYVHALASVELLGLASCYALVAVVARRREGRSWVQTLAVPVGLLVATAAAIAVMPPFRAQRGFSRNDGYLETTYLSWPWGYVAVAIGVTAVSALLLLASLRGRFDRATGSVLQGLAFAGFAIAGPFVAQAVLLAADEGSPYAVKKYVFGLLTLLAVDLCVGVACLVPLRGTDRALGATTCAAAVGLVLVATYAILSQPGHDYFTKTMVELEGRVEDVAASEGLGRHRRDYGLALSASDRFVDLMLTTAVLRPQDARPLRRFLRDDDDLVLASADRLLTRVGSLYDRIRCRRSPARESLVVVSPACVRALLRARRSEAQSRPSAAAVSARPSGVPIS
jgi:hypothetical protein